MGVSVAKRVAQLIRHPRFFIGIAGVFVLKSAWIALSLGYPGPFDENFHLAVIKLYAQQWSPFFLQQPPDVGGVGALTRDPSFLYHYLLSFPYRLVAHLTGSQFVQVLVLRFIDIAFMVGALWLFRQLLLAARASRAIVHTVLLFFVLVPVVPFLAGQINYDNLVIPLAALALLLLVHWRGRIRRGQLGIGWLAATLAVSALASMTQFEFLPILTAICLYVLWELWRFGRRRPLRKNAAAAWNAMDSGKQWLITIGGGIVLLLFVHSYGVNLAVYHNPVPQCGDVLSVSACQSYGPWARNYYAAQHKAPVSLDPITFSAGWLYRIVEYSLYASSGGAQAGAMYLSALPLPVIGLAGLAVAAGGVGLSIYYRKRLLRRYPLLGLFLFIIVVYVGSLWLRNYHDYLQLGQKVGINGRYLFPVLPLLLAWFALAYKEFFARRKAQAAQSWLLVATLLLVLQGGGAITFIEVSNRAWYWPDNPLALHLNAAAHAVVHPFIVHFRLFR